jgi:hypothetical protein
MTDEETKEWAGTLTKQRLFVGSKSEADYWILLTDNNQWYRVAGAKLEAVAQWLEENYGKQVTLIARLDTFRGHRRLVLGEPNWFVPSTPPDRHEPDDGTGDVL